MKFDAIVGKTIITRQDNGKYQVIYADPSENWKITKYTDLSYEEAAQLPFVDKIALSLVK